MPNKPERISMDDDEWEEGMKDLTDDEMVEYGIHVYETMSQNPQDYPGITPEMLEDMRLHNEEFKASINLAINADREAQIATANMERKADGYLAAFDKHDTSQGN